MSVTHIERARRIDILALRGVDEIRADIVKAFAEVEAAERERCAKAICPKCDEGIQIDGEHHVFEGRFLKCKAAAIRRTT